MRRVRWALLLMTIVVSSLSLGVQPAFADEPFEAEVADSGGLQYQDANGQSGTCEFILHGIFTGWKIVETGTIYGTWSYSAETDCNPRFAPYMNARASLYKGTAIQGTAFDWCDPCVNDFAFAVSWLDCYPCNGTWTLKTEHVIDGAVFLSYPSACTAYNLNTKLVCHLQQSTILA